MKKLHLICNAHLDPVWQWQWQEGAGAALSTFRMAARFCREYDGLVFCHNEALLYRWIEDYEPLLFAEIQELVRLGKWHIMGGWFLQPDCNLPSGEGFVRNIISGKKYFHEKFGVKPTTAINFDPFGHSRGLVQIMKKAGFDNYVVCRPNDQWIKLPAETFMWVGYDGSEIMVARSNDGYNSYMGKATEKIEGYVRKLINSESDVGFCLWGVGNHGGGPSRVDLNAIMEKQTEWKDRGVEVLHSTPEAYFKGVSESGTKLPRHEGDLNPWAVGCYTSQIRIKQQYRQLESMLWRCEKMYSALALTENIPYPQKELDEAMYDMILAQFHDILPGTSIKSAEQDALQTLAHGMEIVSKLQTKAFFKLCAGQFPSKPGDIPILAYNPHPYPVEGDFECEFMLADQNWKGTFTDAKVYCGEQELFSQVEKESSNIPLDWRKKVVFHATLPPMQATKLECKLSELERKPTKEMLTDETHYLYDDGTLQVKINRTTGLIDSCVMNGTEYLQEGALAIQVYEDDEDPWGMRLTGWDNQIGAFELLDETLGSKYSDLPRTIPSVRLIEDGDVRTVVEAVFGYGTSHAVVRYAISKQLHTVDVHIDIQNAETKKLYKLAIPFAAEQVNSIAQVAFGEEALKQNVENVNQQYVRLVDITKKEHTLHVYNKGSYGSSIGGNVLKMTLMRAPSYTAHPVGSRPILPTDRQSAYIEQGERNFDFRLSFGKQQNSDGIVAQIYHEEPIVLSYFPPEVEHQDMEKLGAALKLDGTDVLLTAFKKSEEKDDTYIVRLFNSKAMDTTCRLYSERLHLNEQIEFAPFEIKTFEISNHSFEKLNLIE